MAKEDLDIPRIEFKMWTPLSKEEYEVYLDLDIATNIVFYQSLPILLEYEGIDSDYTHDWVVLYEDLFAN